MNDDSQQGQDKLDIQARENMSSVQRTNLSRRKFTKAGLIAAPVMMTLNSRPVLGAYQCTVSGMLSGNQSNIEMDINQCFSKSEGVWRGSKVLGKKAADGTYPKHHWPYPYTPETLFHDFTYGFGKGIYDYGDATMAEVMTASSSAFPGDQNLGFKAMGSLLNAKFFGDKYFGYSDAWIINFWTNWAGSAGDLAEFYSALNHRWDSDSPNPAHGPVF